jgi:hypothetical protein
LLIPKVYNAAMASVPDRESICREQLERVIDSAAFHSSGASRKLLSYLGERTLAGQIDDLKEYTIGVEALGRPAGYDPQVDPSVRVQISRLRKRLEEYHEGEGADDAVIIDLPRRQFALRFVAPASAAEAETHRPPPPPELFWRRTSLALAITLALALGGVLYFGGPSPPLSAAAAGGGFTPEMREFWQPYFESDLPVKLSLGIALFVRIPGETPTATTYVRQAQINDWPLKIPVPSLDNLRSALGSKGELNPAYTYSGVGEAMGAYLLGKHFERAGLDIPMVRSPFLSWDDVRNSNIIFVGPPKFNRQIEAGPYEKNFRVVRGGVENLHPIRGEPSFYGKEAIVDGRPTVAHAVISRFKSGGGPGVVTIFSSNDSTGTWAGVEEVTQTALLSELLAALRQPDGSIPESFEVVVRARFDMDYPVEVSYVTHRAY